MKSHSTGKGPAVGGKALPEGRRGGPTSQAPGNTTPVSDTPGVKGVLLHAPIKDPLPDVPAGPGEEGLRRVGRGVRDGTGSGGKVDSPFLSELQAVREADLCYPNLEDSI